MQTKLTIKHFAISVRLIPSFITGLRSILFFYFCSNSDFVLLIMQTAGRILQKELKTVLKLLFVLFVCMALLAAEATIMEDVERCTMKIGNYYAVSTPIQWFNHRKVELQTTKPSPLWIARNLCGTGGEECYQLGYDDSHNRCWWLSTSGYLNRATTEKDVWHYIHYALWRLALYTLCFMTFGIIYIMLYDVWHYAFQHQMRFSILKAGDKVLFRAGKK